MLRFRQSLVAGHVLLQPLTRLQEVHTPTIFLLLNRYRYLDHVLALLRMLLPRPQLLRLMEGHSRNHYVQLDQTGGHDKHLPLLGMRGHLLLIAALPPPLHEVTRMEDTLYTMATITQDEQVLHQVVTTRYPEIGQIR